MTTALACSRLDELSGEQFEALRAVLEPPPGEVWRSLPWEISLFGACDTAARACKPIMMLVRSGHPLGGT